MGDPGNTGGFTPKSNHGPGAGHKGQPKGRSIGAGGPPHRPNQTYQDELREHWGSKANGGKDMGNRTNSEVANTGPADRGSNLVENCGVGHETAKGVHGIGVGSSPRVRFGEAHSFKTRGNPLRNSGRAGAHRVGKK
jgi:hypothetical protein